MWTSAIFYEVGSEHEWTSQAHRSSDPLTEETSILSLLGWEGTPSKRLTEFRIEEEYVGWFGYAPSRNVDGWVPD